MSFVLGLTGSIGMGKSTTAQMFADAGVPVWDADAVVRKLYGAGGSAADAVVKHYPEAIENGAVSREKLRALIAANPAILDHIQKIVHPLVAADRAEFLEIAVAPIVVLDIPLLFETGTDSFCDAIAVVSTTAVEQRERVLGRGEMSEADFELILSRQMPDAEKRARARWVILTQTLDGARRSVKDILVEIAKELPDA
ncbi:dephospho-CoA kinase [Octadecabacter temperatus]|uniref:Dephospho-CoA kinase n=1 Tax=Octadecabacter temperatus TaxID=1458307 RepID=A0A0K0Y9X3_9RHOB|nr:dephospho-CoA kinase [Octadecabacter temperatus]AKS47725.1 Dephospho-CoA kinase [Octadecabacter temperatus]SIO39364.1 dephospho-CoA kinase [Octadecabacter temperatus]